MRKLICYDCKDVFTEEEAGTLSECVGEFWGAPAFMDYNACPRCGSTELEDYEGSEDEE